MYSITRNRLHAAIFCVLGMAAFGALSTSASAGEDVATKTVKFSDLDLGTPDGAKTLYHRIRVAAQEVCDKSAGNDPILRYGEPGCIDKAIDSAVKKVNAPYLTALRTGRDVSTARLASK
jgi:UrcA family protein